jgi:hypothetical protein
MVRHGRFIAERLSGNRYAGHAGDRIRRRQLRADGFGLCGFAAIHIPESER